MKDNAATATLHPIPFWGVGVAVGAMLAASFTPIADADWLEPSIRNEVDHALAVAPTNAPAPVAYSPATNGLSKTDLAIRLVSMQKADGRWYDGTNDVSSAVISILENLIADE